MNHTIIGYQWGDNGQFIGEYAFPNNLDRDEIHLPPKTTLIAPPPVKPGEIAVWNGEEWNTQIDPFYILQTQIQEVQNSIANNDQVEAERQREIEANREAEIQAEIERRKTEGLI